MLRDDWEEAIFDSGDRRPPDESAALSDMLTVRLGAILTELGDLGGISRYRIAAITRGEEEPTDGELEEIGYACVQLMRALKDE